MRRSGGTLGRSPSAARSSPSAFRDGCFLWRGSRFRFAALAKRAEGVSSVRSRCSHVWGPVVQLHHRTRVPPPYHSNLDRAAHIFLRRSAEFPEPADEFPDARRSIENLMLHCSAQCQQDFRHECLRSALPTMPTGRDPTTRRSRRSKKPRKTRGARRSAPPENNLAHARPKVPCAHRDQQ